MAEMNGWTQCPAGELDRLETRLKAAQQIQVVGKSAATIVLAAIIVVGASTVLSAIWPALPFSHSAETQTEKPGQGGRRLPRPPQPGAEEDEGPNFPEIQRDNANPRTDGNVPDVPENPENSTPPESAPENPPRESDEPPQP